MVATFPKQNSSVQSEQLHASARNEGAAILSRGKRECCISICKGVGGEGREAERSGESAGWRQSQSQSQSIWGAGTQKNKNKKDL